MELIASPQLGEFRDRWDDVNSQMGLPNPFFESWWLENVWKGRSRYLMAFSGGEFVGGLPLQADRWKGVPRFQLLGQGPLMPTFPDVLALPGQEGDVAGMVLAWLSGAARRRRGAAVDLLGFGSEGFLAKSLEAAGHPVVPIMVDPYANVGRDHETYLASRSGRHKEVVEGGRPEVRHTRRPVPSRPPERHRHRAG